MENVILIVHLIVALCLIGVVLLQRSEGGLGGLGGGGGGVVSARGAANALGRLTWIFAIAFFCTSVALTVIAARNSAGTSVVDRLGGTAAPAESTQDTAPAPDAGGLYAPPPGTAEPATPPRAD